LIQSAAINTPRFDHDPVTLACKGLLIEEGRTNLLSSSEEFNNADWGKNFSAGVTVLANQANSPDGRQSMNRVTSRGAGGSLYHQNAPIALSTTHSVSMFIRQGTATTSQMAIFNWNSGNIATLNWTWVGGVPSTSASWMATNVRYENFGGGMYRVAFTFTSLSNGAHTILYVPDTTAGLGDGFAWGAQLEAGSFPTSYIPTTTGTLARSADVCSITGGAFSGFYNQSEGAFLLKATSLMATATTGNRTFVSFTDGSYFNQQGLYKSTNTTNLSFPIGAGIGPSVGAITAGSPFAVSGAFAASNCAASFNGAAAVTVAGSPSTVVTKLEFRDPTAAASGHPTMHISQFRYYRKRLPDAKIQALTV
jgi:hypothetical protein